MADPRQTDPTMDPNAQYMPLGQRPPASASMPWPGEADFSMGPSGSASAVPTAQPVIPGSPRLAASDPQPRSRSNRSGRVAALIAGTAALALLMGGIGGFGLSQVFAPNNGVVPGSMVQPTPDPNARAASEPAPSIDPDNGIYDCVGDTSMAAHWARLEKLDPTFRDSGWQAWLNDAGVTWDGNLHLLNKDARQIEEETNSNLQPLAAGVQVKDGVNVIIRWPNMLTTTKVDADVEPLDGFQELPLNNNPSVLYTNVAFNGQGTIWIDGTNWGQFASVQGCDNDTSGYVPAADPEETTDPGTPDSALADDPCLAIAKNDEGNPVLGSDDYHWFPIVENAQGAENGLLYDGDTLSGAVIKFQRNTMRDRIDELTDAGWTIQGTNPTIRSAWSPQSCRPLS